MRPFIRKQKQGQLRARVCGGQPPRMAAGTSRTICPAPAKPFTEDTADKLGVDARTVRRQVQIAKDVTPEAQEVIENSGAKVTQQNLLKLSRLSPGQQTEAAAKLVSGEIKSVDDYGKSKEESEAEQMDYYKTGAFLTDAFCKAVSGLYGVPNGHREHLDNYRSMLSAEQLQEMLKSAQSGRDLLADYIDFLSSELDYAQNEERKASA